ncbi:MAG: glycogen/starch synthase [Sulfurimonadaceae bacterium]
MNILFASSEIFPYAKSGGLADVAYALPQALRENETVYTVMPLYDIVNRKKHKIVDMGISFWYTLNHVAHQFDLFYKEDCKEDLFIYNPILCGRTGLYHDRYGEFGDNALRFGLFSYAIIEMINAMKLSIDVFHINDWQTSLVALLAKTHYHLPQKVILTLHNLAYQGIFDKSVMNELALNWEACFKYNGIEYFDSVNFLKAGINYSDAITTVSASYAQEIQTPLFGCGLDETLKSNSHKLMGIVNGISTEVFNPKTDEYLYNNYDQESLKDKKINKTKLLKLFNLQESSKALFVFVGRFTHQKGVDLLLESLPILKDFDANFIILGEGEPYYNERFKQVQHQYSSIHIEVGYNEELSRKLYAAADFLLMPSTFEPCGLNQMIAMRYGAMPIVSKTGGLKDTVLDFTDINTLETSKGVGITFEEHNLFWFLHAIGKAFSLYGNNTKYKRLIQHNMSIDFSWKSSAQLYLQLYKEAK